MSEYCKRWSNVLLAFVLSIGAPCAQETRSVASGLVMDAETREPITGAVVRDLAGTRATATNRSGYFALPIDQDGIVLQFSAIGYRTSELRLVGVEPDEWSRLLVRLDPEPVDLGAVAVEASRAPFGSAASVGTVELDARDVVLVPSVGGERDLFRALQQFPGVKAGGDLNSGLYIRGGGSDQNLVLLDGVPVYNPWHLFGVFSAFNTEAIRDVRLIKGVSPAEYGGRLSGVLDLELAEGRRDRFGGSTQVGMVSSQAFVNGPVTPDVTAAVGVRRTYLDVAVAAAETAGVNASESFPSYHFSDVTAKLTWRPSPTQLSAVSLLYGSDVLGVSRTGTQQVTHPVTGERFLTPSRGSVGYEWSNFTLGLRHERAVSPLNYLSARVHLTRYRQSSLLRLASDSVRAPYGASATGGYEFGPAAAALGYDVSLTDIAARADLDVFAVEDHQIRAGIAVTVHDFSDRAIAEADPYYDYLFVSGSTERTVQPFELAAYAQDDLAVTSRLRVQAGARLDAFQGGGRVRLSPRVSVVYDPSPRVRLALGVGRTSQFIQRTSDELVPVLNDRWLPAGEGIGAADGVQLAGDLGWTPQPGLKLSASTYLRRLSGIYTVSSYRRDGELEGGLEVLRPQLREAVQGTGTAYGLELLAEYTGASLGGRAGYTLARTERTFAELAGGRPFAGPADRLHEAQVTGWWRGPRGWRAGVSFSVRSGEPLSLPVGYAVTHDPLRDGEPLPTFDFVAYRGSRAAPYHRLDVSAGGPLVHLRGRPLFFSVDVFNVYNASNPLVTLPVLSGDPGQRRLAVEEYGALPVLPSFALRYDF